MSITALVGGLAAPLFSLIDKMYTSDEERLAAKMKLMQLEKSGELKELEVRMSAIVAEAQSEDPYTSRARPSFLYVMYILFFLCMIGSILGVWFPAEVFQASTNMQLLFSALPEELYWLFGSGYLGYVTARSVDKRKKDAN